MTDKDETTVVADAEVVTDNEQTEALATVDETEMSPATQFDDNDPMLVANITLPTEDDITVKRIDDLLKSSFDNFTFDENADMSLQFDDIDAVADYSMRSMKDIREKELKKDSQNRTKNAIIITRLWCLCKTWSDTAAKSKKYGAGAVQKLAAKLGFSQSYMYSLIAVGKNLTKTDAYLLGVRDVGSKTLRDVAAIKDDMVRKTAIREFCESYRETANIRERDEAKRKLVLATGIGSKKESFEGDLTANPGSDKPDTTPEYEGAISAMSGFLRLVDKLSKEDATNNIQQYASNYFMMRDTPGSEEMHADVIEKAKALRDACISAQANIDIAIKELDSLMHVELLDNEK